MKYGSRRRVRQKSTSSSTGWLRMHIWRTRLWRTKSHLISWHGLFVKRTSSPKGNDRSPESNVPRSLNPQNLVQPFPHPNDATHKIWSRLANWLQRYSSSKVWNFHHSRASNSKMNGMIRLKIKLDQPFMPVLVTSNFDDVFEQKWTS